LRRWLAAGRCARCQDPQVTAAPGAQPQHALQRHRPHQASVEVGQDGVDRDGAEAPRDGGEAARDGAVFEGLREVAAIAGEHGDDGEDFRDARGRGPAGPLLCGSGAGRNCGGVGCGGHRLAD